MPHIRRNRAVPSAVPALDRLRFHGNGQTIRTFSPDLPGAARPAVNHRPWLLPGTRVVGHDDDGAVGPAKADLFAADAACRAWIAGIAR
jgi:hypothetical protein